jgi:hypothetical protein
MPDRPGPRAVTRRRFARGTPGYIIGTMPVGMPNKRTAAKAGVKGATKVARSRTARRAAKTGAKASWIVGKKIAKRKVRKRARRYGDAASKGWSAARIYVPMAVEALGLVEQPKPRRRSPAFAAGIAVGAGAMYLAGRRRTT